MNRGDLNPMRYRDMLQDNISKDEKLLNYYQNKSVPAHLKYLEIRLECTKADMKDVDELIKSQAFKGNLH